jgi:hypothetical protein
MSASFAPTNRLGRQLRRSLRLVVVTAGLLAACGGEQVRGQFSKIVNVPPNPAPEYIDSNTQVNVLTGGVLPQFVQSGYVTGTARNIEVNVMGGTVGQGFEAYGGTVMNVSAGIVRENMDAIGSSVVNISGGSVGHSFSAANGAMVNVIGGALAESAYVNKSKMKVSSGSVGHSLHIYDGSTLDVLGGEVGVGMSIDESTANISAGLVGGGILLTEGVLNVTGGTVGNNINSAFGSAVNISGGAVGSGLLLQTASRLTLQAGSLGANAELRGNDIVANISGGTVGASMRLEFGAKLNLSGGSVGTNFKLNWGTVNASGGTFEGTYLAADYTTTNLYGTHFTLGGVDITPSLTVGMPYRVPQREVTLAGLLADSSPFSFDLNTSYIADSDRFGYNSHVYLHLQPGPGDFNGDGLVNGTDLLSWQRGQSPSPLSAADLESWRTNFPTRPNLPGDFDGNQRVDGDDLLAWQRNHGVGGVNDWRTHFGAASHGNVAAVPESTSQALLALAAAVTLSSRRRMRG